MAPRRPKKKGSSPRQGPEFPVSLHTLKRFYTLALELALKKLAWALDNLDDASSDQLVKLALSKGLDQKLPEESLMDTRIEVVLTATAPPPPQKAEEPPPSGPENPEPPPPNCV